jgi:N-acetylglutamate synthase-like GNAT family acetyltransferase
MIDLRPRLKEPAIRELMALSIGNPAPERVEQICQRYQYDLNWKIMGYERNGFVVGCIGVEVSVHKQGFIRCISILPSARRQGIGREMVNYVASANGVTQLIARTDKDAVSFYRKCGFQVKSLGELYPGVERFECVKDL